ncbi:hypothetical protein [Flavobacterium terrisoli]|uniref:hypothetical protein n=1 Tax=Flavobacterium terrisoli TaxID=3242195 RepID=UPI002542987D|nr:hypothetical protein [Flavobacterium buctense]
MGNKKEKKQAVVIIHGIGSQFPMDTAREFVENIKDKNDVLYSSPDREANFFETRRLSLSGKKFDFYEFYWANLVTEPNNSDLIEWLRKLLFKNKPSLRAKSIILFIRLLVFVLVSLFAAFIIYDYFKNGKRIMTSILNTGILSVLTFMFFRYFLPRINLKTAQTVGDAVKYLTPSPQNIDSRFKIRQKGVELLKKLHEKKDKNGEPLYSRIVIVGHSLGSIVGYDIITNLWHDYTYSYAPEKAPVLQPILGDMSSLVSDYHKYNENLSKKKLNKKEQEEKNKKKSEFQADYYRLQEQLYDEIKSLKNPWLISDFITVGSPLCHGAYIMAKSEEEFIRKTNYRELPLSPPKIEVKQVKDKIEKDYTKAISYEDDIHSKEDKNVKMRIINHSSQFSLIRWNNIYFENDYVGGDLNCYFGDGIQNHKFKANGSYFKRKLPCASHTNYWDDDQKASLDLFKKILFAKKNIQ